MRVLFATISEKSHVYALTPVAWALSTAGHEVAVASNPSMVDTIQGTGLTAVSVGTDHQMHEMLTQSRASVQNDVADWTVTDPEKLTWEQVLFKYRAAVPFAFAVYNESMLDDLVAFARSWRPDLIIWDPLTYAGPIAARASGAAHARILSSVDQYSLMRDAFFVLQERQPPERREDPLGEWLTKLLGRYGCSFDEEITTGQWSIDYLPDSLQAPLNVRRVPVRYTPYNGPSLFPDWVLEPPARPRVCLTLGLSYSEVFGGDFLSVPDLLDAVAGLDVEVVTTLTAAQADELTTVPDNVRVVRFVPLHALLPTCSAVVHHGGFGTYATAYVNAVPQLVVHARQGDAPLKAQAIADAGAGLHIPAAELTADRLRGDLSRLLDDPSFREGAERLRKEVQATASPNGLVTTLESLTVDHRRPA